MQEDMFLARSQAGPKADADDGPLHLVETMPRLATTMPTAEDARAAVLGNWESHEVPGDWAGCSIVSSRSQASIRAWEERDPVGMLRVLRGRRRRLGVLAETYLLGAFKGQETLFLDLETMGLRDVPVFLVGAGFNQEDAFRVHQFLATSLEQEESMLRQALGMIERAKVLVTYNGRRADIAWLVQRFRHFGMSWPAGIAHLDLLVLVRQVFGEELPNCKLATVESHLLGIRRQGDLPGRLVPPAYQAFLDSGTGNLDLIEPILLHNRLDIEALAQLSSYLWAERDSDRAIYSGSFKPARSKLPWRPSPVEKRLAPESASSLRATMP